MHQFNPSHPYFFTTLNNPLTALVVQSIPGYLSAVETQAAKKIRSIYLHCQRHLTDSIAEECVRNRQQPWQRLSRGFGKQNGRKAKRRNEWRDRWQEGPLRQGRGGSGSSSLMHGLDSNRDLTNHHPSFIHRLSGDLAAAKNHFHSVPALHN